MATASSSAISSFISEASSDLDPLFHSPQIRDSRQQSSQASSSRPSPNLNSEFSSNLSPISSFPLPPRRLRPGERIEVSDLFATNLLAASSFAAEKKSPSSAYPQLAPHNPVSLYGVAIGGGNITNSLKKFNGRAEIQQSTGYSALQLRKLSLKNRNNQNQSNGSKENLNDGTSLRARTPARILAPSAASGNSNSPSSSALLPESPPPNSRVSVIEKASMPPPRPQRTDSLVSFTGIDEEKFTATNALSVRPSLSILTDQLQPAQLLLRNAVQSRLNPSNHLEPPSNQAINESLIIPANFIGGEATLRPYVGLNHLTDPKEVERIIQSSPSHTESGLIINSSKVKSNPITVPFQPNSNQKLESRNVEQSSNNKTSLIKFATSPVRSMSNQSYPGNSELNSFSDQKPSGLKKKPMWITRWLVSSDKKSNKSASSSERPKTSGSATSESIHPSGSGLLRPPNVEKPDSRFLKLSNGEINGGVSESPSQDFFRPRSQSFSEAQPNFKGTVSNSEQHPPPPPLPVNIFQEYSMDSAQSKRNFLGRNSRPSTSSATMSHGVFKRKETNLKAPTQQNGLNDLSNFRKSRPAGETHEKSFSNPKSLKEFEPKIGRPPPASVVRRPHTAAVDGKTEMKMKIGGSKFDRSESNPFKKKREIRFRNTLELIPDPIYLKKPSDSYYDELSPQLQSSLLGSFTSNRPTLIKIQDGDLSDPSKLGLNSSEMNFETEAYEDYNQGGIEDDMETNLSKRKLAPRVNLTFVDLDRHIGSRFSVNTLFREVQKNLPFVSAPEEPDLKPLRSPSETSDRNTLMNEQLNPTSTFYSNGEGKNSSESGSLRRYDDGEEIQQSPTSLATTEPDIQLKDGGSKENTGPRVEIVKTEGSEVMFQMIVPASNNFNPKLSLIQGSRSVNNIPEDLENYLSNQRPNEEELTRISERLSELNRSFESQNISKQALIHSKGIGLEKEQNIAIQPLKPERIERIENWLISVPLAPENQRLQGEVVPKSGSTSNYEDANSSFTDDGVEKGVVASVQSSEGEESDLGKDDLDEDCPESPIDRYTLSQAPIKLARTGSKSKASLIIRSNSQRLHDASLTQKNQNDAKEFIEETKSSEDNKNSQLRTSEKKLLDSHTMNIKNIRVLSQ